MLLVSRESELKLFTELASIDKTHEVKEKSLSFVLDDKFTDNHQINLVVEDKKN